MWILVHDSAAKDSASRLGVFLLSFFPSSVSDARS
jgi:hypothetical protein